MASPFDGLVAQGGVPVTLYGPDGATVRASTLGLLSSAREMTVTGARGDDVRGILPSTVTAAAGDVLNAPSIPLAWFLVRKVVIHTPGLLQLATELSLLALPYSLSIIRPSSAQQAAPRNAWFEVAGTTPTDTTGRIPGTGVSHTVRLGLSNSNNPETETIIGPTQNGLFTAYTPLDADVQLGDQVTLPDGRPAQVDTLNTLYADGTAYALQPILRLTMGTGLSLT